MNHPTDAGLYWVEVAGRGYYCGVAHVEGMFPFLRITGIWLPFEDELLKHPTPDLIVAWGARIEDPTGKPRHGE